MLNILFSVAFPKDVLFLLLKGQLCLETNMQNYK